MCVGHMGVVYACVLICVRSCVPVYVYITICVLKMYTLLSKAVTIIF